MGGKTSGQAITEYAGIQVQTSSMGLQIPVGWGQFRCKCNLVWYGAFQAKAQKAASSGKGGSTTTGYSYSASLILAICEGPIDAIDTIYVDSKVYTNGPSTLDPGGSGTALSQANLNLATGEIGQAVWSYLTTNFPSQAIGYSGLAIAYQANYALDSGASTPNHSFEVIRTTGYGPITTASGVDCDPSLVIADFFQNPRTGVPSWPGAADSVLDPVSLALYQDYCLAAGLLLSPLIDQERTASDFLTEMFLATNSTCVWSEGLLKFIPYGDTNLSGNGKTYTAPVTPVYDLDDDDFIVEKDEPPLLVDIEDQSDAYNVVQLEYLDRTNQYNMAIALASDAANVAQYGARRQDPTQIHVVCDPTIASLSAQLYLQRTLYIRAQYKFKLSWAFALLEPGDIVALTDSGLGLNQYTVRVIQIDQDEKYGLSFICEDYPIGVAHSPLYEMQLGDGYQVNQNADPGTVEANLLLWSRDFTQSVWTKVNATVAVNASIDDPYGGATGQLFASSAAGAFGAYQQYDAGALPGRVFTFSVWLANGSATIADPVTLQLQSSNGESLAAIEVVPENGVFNRYSVTCPMGALADTVVNAVMLLTASASGQTFWAWGAQLIEGVDEFRAYAETTTTIAGPILLNPPPALGAGSSMYAAAAGGPNWGGCNIWVSIDGDSYEQVGTQTVPARFGRLTADFPSHADPDTADTLAVDLGWSSGALTGASSTTAVDNGATSAWIGPAGELVAYESATLTNPSRYSLGSYIRRGFLNTPIADHPAGALFVRLDNGIFEFPYLDVNSGVTVYVKFQSFNVWGQGLQSLADCIAYATVPNPVAANAPGAGAWTAVAATLSSGGVTIPVLEITGAIDNPSASAIHLYYRVTGAGAWTAGGTFPPATTIAYITGLVSGDDYDAAISYVVGGVETALTQIGSALAMPAVAGIAAGATRNVTTYSATAPTSPQNGDIWVDTADNPPITYLNVGGTWEAAANYVTGTSQIADTANLGGTAAWSGVSAKPSNVAALGGSEAIQNAILQSALTAGSVVPAQSSTITSQGTLATLNQVDTTTIAASGVETANVMDAAIQKITDATASAQANLANASTSSLILSLGVTKDQAASELRIDAAAVLSNVNTSYQPNQSYLDIFISGASGAVATFSTLVWGSLTSSISGFVILSGLAAGSYTITLYIRGSGGGEVNLSTAPLMVTEIKK